MEPSSMGETSTLNSRETIGLVSFLLIVAGILLADLIGDFQSDSSALHLLTEGCLAIAALTVAGMVWKKYRGLKRENIELRVDIAQVRESERAWKEAASKHIEGLSHAIEEQFQRWHLTPTEKEVALLLLKGLSLKEIAAVRASSERTVRQHSLMVYQKSGLGGRAELAAFFLEDLLAPVVKKNV